MRTRLLRLSIAALFLGLAADMLARPMTVRAGTYTVNTSDDVDDGLCNPANCSLHEAINTANANPGPDEIVFSFGEGGVHTIFLETPLPDILDDATTLDGTRSPYFGGIPLVVLDFSALEHGAGLLLSSDDNAVRGLSIVGNQSDLGDGIRVHGSRNRIEGNYLGVEPAGIAHGNKSGVSFSWTGTDSIVRGNLISGNDIGIEIYSGRQTVVGNIIGLNPGGTAKLGDQGLGIDIYSDGNRIGASDPGNRNVISGGYTGISIAMNADYNTISNNFIGTNAEGTAAVPNSLWGISMGDSQWNTIGGDEPGAGNLISGNGTGINACTNRLIIRGNKIGTDASGARPIPNAVGIKFTCRGEGSQIGADFAFGGNQIAFNTGAGIETNSTSSFSIQKNTIARNGGDGISLSYWRTLDDGNRITISENSIYANGGLGIAFQSEFVNRGIAPPVITGATSLYANGTACPGCRIELFLADPDPSGNGEGKTFVISAAALGDGTFMLRFPDIGTCKQLTATATDALGNTSEFSHTVGVGICFRLPMLTAWILVLGGAGAGSSFMLVIVFLLRRRRPSGMGGTIGFGLLGSLLGAGIVVGLLSLPVVQVERAQGSQAGQAPSAPPACGQFIDPAVIRPEDGETFEPGTDVLFELSPQPDPPGMQTRWFLEVGGPGNNTISRELTSNSIHLSELGFDPEQTGVYFWTLKGERSQTGANIWTPLCQNSVQRMFHIAAPPPVRPTATVTAAPTDTPTVTPTSSPPTAILLQNANCRRGPGTEYDSVANLPQGSNVPIIGRNQNQSWWQVQVPGSQMQCWVGGETVETSGDTSGVPVVEPPPLGCWVWNSNQQKNVCTVPCPDGAKPGGTCEP